MQRQGREVLQNSSFTENSDILGLRPKCVLQHCRGILSWPSSQSDVCHFLVLVVSCPAPPVYLGNISFLDLQWGWRLGIVMVFLSYDSNWIQNFGLIKAREIVEYFLRIYQVLMDWILWMYSSLNKFSYCITFYYVRIKAFVFYLCKMG